MAKLSKTLSTQITLSKSLLLNRITMTIQLEVQEEGFGKVGIYIDPGIFGDDLFLREQLFFKGICNGINLGIGSLPVKYSDDADLEVEVSELEFSVPLIEMSNSEIDELRSSLEDLATRLIQDILIEIDSSDTTKP